MLLPIAPGYNSERPIPAVVKTAEEKQISRRRHGEEYLVVEYLVVESLNDIGLTAR
jgi:hypothetical protein